jgi:hypothetical protein
MLLIAWAALAFSLVMVGVMASFVTWGYRLGGSFINYLVGG